MAATRFQCGVEVPLRANEFLVELNESTGKLETATTANERLSRYSFVSHRDGIGRSGLIPLVARLSRGVPGELKWLCAFERNSGSGAMRPRVLASRLHKYSWKTWEEPDFIFGMRGFALYADNSWPPAEADDVISGSCLIAWSDEGSSNESTRVLLPSLRRLAAYKTLHPSREALAACATHHVSLLYVAKSQLRDRPSLVVITQAPLLGEIHSLQREGLIEDIFFNEEAESAWKL